MYRENQVSSCLPQNWTIQTKPLGVRNFIKANLSMKTHFCLWFQGLFKTTEIWKMKLFFCYRCSRWFRAILWAVVLLLARVHVIPDEWQKTKSSPPLPRQQWLSSLSFKIHTVLFYPNCLWPKMVIETKLTQSYL